MPSSAWLTLVYFPVSAATAVRLMLGRRGADLAQGHVHLDGLVGGFEGVGRAVVAVDAIHHADRRRRRIALEIRAAINPHLARGQRGHADPGNDLPLRVGGVVFHPVGHVHVPVDAAEEALARLAAADADREPHGVGRVVLVGKIVHEATGRGCR